MLEVFEDLPGPKFVMTMALTLGTFEDKMYRDYCREETLELPCSGISTFTVGVTPQNLRPYHSHSYRATVQRLGELTGRLVSKS